MVTTEDKARILLQLACPCCGNLSIDKRLLTSVLKMERLLGYKLQINSGFRCQHHNNELVTKWIQEAIAFEKVNPGKKFQKPKPSLTSRHRLGLAIDIQCPKALQPALIAAARKVGFNGIGIGQRMVHCDYRDEPKEWRY